ncbi:hypothetical protein ACHIPZ_13735 [Antrihabitans sp. NCIMB 15449]|uniref:Uncharacterized protein n=1 Tax=Antrihabitans spumae TaxID=3373370 RepID=A0ABW7JML0_9NOCA
MTTLQATESTIRATAMAIGRAALFDDKITAGDRGRLAAWAEALEPIGLDQADMLSAVTAYYQANANGRTIQVSDLIRCGRELRRDRAERDKARTAAFAPPDTQLGALPIGGADGKPIWAAYDVNEAIERPCPLCGAEANQSCVNPVNNNARRIPCLMRLTGKGALAW